MTQTRDRLTAISLDQKAHAQTCNYWYLVHCGSMSHTAFTTYRGLMRWLEERGLTLESELPHGAVIGTSVIVGSYREEMHMSYDAFFALPNVVLETRELSNGQYTLARITKDEDGVRTVHTLNPNCHHRPVFDYETSRLEMK